MMRRLATAALLLAAVLVRPAFAAEPGVPQPGPPNPPLQLLSDSRMDARLHELTFSTPYVTAPTPVRVLFPTGYDPRSSRRYPVLYLLHGCCDDWRSWTDKGAAEALTANLPLIVVMPDASARNTQDGWYSDWYNGGSFGDPRWESYHIGQLIPWIDSHYRTVASRAGRAIAGLSMGGFGTMSYAARHPDLFVAAAAFSGAVDSNDPAPVGALAFGGNGATWGQRWSDEVRWRAHNPWDLAGNLRGLSLTLRTGDGTPGGPYDAPPPTSLGQDAIEAVVHRQMVNMHERLDDLQIAHTWQDYGPGTHDWPYWQRDLKLTLPSIMATFANPPAAPVPFDFTAAEPEFEAYGYRVQMHRQVLEFATLEDVRPAGFSLIGSGTADVVTAPRYAPGALYTVTSEDGAGTTASSAGLRADAQGRLHVELDLGPSNTTQDYTLGQPNPKRTATVRIARMG
jgi:S-formylglutathione hydrolase FrmB